MIDHIEIEIKAGDGGNGVVSFRREKFVPYGGPDGGDGGNGGDVVIEAEHAVSSLLAFRRKRFYRAATGKAGRGKRQHGKNGDDLVLKVPSGTVIFTKTRSGETSLLVDLEESGQRVVVAKGGNGGWGNFAP